MTTGRITVIVVAFRSERWLRPCLQTMQSASVTPFELIVIDNGENSNIADAVASIGNARIIATGQSMPFAIANNSALRHLSAGAEYVCFLNQDTLTSPGWLDACATVMDADPGLGAVVPLTRTYDGGGWDPAFWDCAGSVPGLHEAMTTGAALEPLYEVFAAPAAAMFVRRSAMDRSGPFDPVFGSYYEDYDLCRRLRESGYRVGIVTTASVCHQSGSSTVTDRDRRARGRLIVRNRALYQIRLAGARRIRAVCRYSFVEFPRNLVRSILGRSAHPPGEFLRGNLDLLLLMPRLVSAPRDARLFRQSVAAHSGVSLAAATPAGVRV